MADPVAPAEDEWLKPAEVAGPLKVNVTTVVRWVKTGRLPATRTPGGHWRIRRSDVEKLIETAAAS